MTAGGFAASSVNVKTALRSPKLSLQILVWIILASNNLHKKSPLYAFYLWKVLLSLQQLKEWINHNVMHLLNRFEIVKFNRMRWKPQEKDILNQYDQSGKR